MGLTKNIILLWKNKGQIIEGITNSIFKKEDVEEIAEERHNICKTNVCKHYDPLGIAEKTLYKGEEACAACGCKMSWKIRSLSSSCGLKLIGQTPLWDVVLNADEEHLLKQKISY